MQGRKQSFNRLLFAVCLAQGTAIVGFDFALPFMPLYLQQDLGVHGLGAVAIWSGVIGFGPAIPATVLGPIWGRLADRFGYRKMLLRAMISAAILLALMGFAQSVWMLLFLRMVQGGLTGTIYSAQALVASSAPEKEAGRAMGLLQMSVYAGATLGPVAGGVVAQLAGYRASFVGAGVLLAVATVIVFAFVTEPSRKEVRSDQSTSGSRRSFASILSAPAFAGAVIFTVLSQFVASSQYPILPLFVQQLLGGTGSVSADTGWVLAVSGLSAATGAYSAGRLQRKFGLLQLIFVSVAACVVLLAMQAIAPSYLIFLALRAVATFCLGGLFALVGAWTAFASPADAKGAAFGLVGAAASFGFGIGPLMGGLLVSVAGIRSVFVFSALLLLLAGGTVVFTCRGGLQASAPRTVEQPSLAG
jgi:DHA1 family multidrug resistance protein-like MFS transporter